MIIAESENFTVESHKAPEVSRSDGGHIVINPKKSIEDRTRLSSSSIIEMALLTAITGRAMKDGLKERGIEIGRINYQDNGNWRPEIHIHLYGRAYEATYQVYGEPIKAARKIEDKLIQEPLDELDCKSIRDKLLEYAKEKDYSILLTLK